MKIKINLKTLIISSIMLLLPTITLASNQVVMTIKNPDPYTGNQSWFNFEEPAGGLVSDTIILRNNSNQVEHIKLYGTDAYNNDAGSFVLKDFDDQQNGIGAWTKLSQNEVTLQAEEEKEIDFLIRIPENIAPGQYFGGILKEDNQLEGNGNIKVRTRTGNRIYLTIPGETNASINLLSVNHQYLANNKLNFQFRIENSGNVAFIPQAKITITDYFGNEIETIEKELGKSLPKSSIAPIVNWNYQNHRGNFKAKIRVTFEEIDYGSNNSRHGSALYSDAEITFFIFPWTWIYLILTLVIAIGSYYIYRTLRFRTFTKDLKSYKVQSNETLEEIAEKQKVPWKILARINKIKPPYSIRENQTLKIPKNESQK